MAILAGLLATIIFDVLSNAKLFDLSESTDYECSTGIGASGGCLTEPSVAAGFKANEIVPISTGLMIELTQVGFYISGYFCLITRLSVR